MEHLYIQARDSLNAVNAVNDNDNNDGDGDGDGDYKGEDVALQDDEGYKIFIANQNYCNRQLELAKLDLRSGFYRQLQPHTTDRMPKMSPESAW